VLVEGCLRRPANFLFGLEPVLQLGARLVTSLDIEFVGSSLNSFFKRKHLDCGFLCPCRALLNLRVVPSVRTPVCGRVIAGGDPACQAAADIRNVDTVIIGGAIRKFRGKLVGVNMTKFRQQVDESRHYLFQQAGYQLDIFSS
jgi:hypothetical protein